MNAGSLPSGSFVPFVAVAQSSFVTPTGERFTITVPVTVNVSPSIPTNDASARLSSRPVYLFAGVTASCTITMLRFKPEALNPIALSTLIESSPSNAPPTPANTFTFVSSIVRSDASVTVVVPSVTVIVPLNRSKLPDASTNPNASSVIDPLN